MISTSRADRERLLALLHAAEIGAKDRAGRTHGPGLTRRERRQVQEVLDAFGPFVSPDHHPAPMVHHQTRSNAQVQLRAGAFGSAATRREIQALLRRVAKEPESEPLPTWFKLSGLGIAIFVALLAELQSWG